MLSNLPARWVLLFAMTAGWASAQKPPVPASAEELVRLYLEHSAGTQDAAQNYTFVILHRDINYIHGKLSSDTTKKSEQIFIGGMPYIRRLERNGKPLAGKDLDREQELYDTAVRERTGLTDEVRGRLIKAKSKTINMIPRERLVSDFRAEIAGREVLGGRECVVLELTPLRADAPPELQRHIRLSLDAEKFDVVHAWIQTLAASDGFSKDTVVEWRSQYVEGALLPLSDRMDTTVQMSEIIRKVDVHVIGTNDYSDFHHFKSSSVIRDVPDGTPPAPPGTS